MRAAFLLVGLCAVAGCGKKSQDVGDESPGGDKPKPYKLPAPSLPADARATPADVRYEYSRHEDGWHHPLEGKQLLFKFDNSLFGATDGDGNPAMLHWSDDGFRQPQTIVRFEKSIPLKRGAIVGAGYAEGTLVGLRDLKSLPWASAWHGLGTQTVLPGKVLIIEPAILVSAPK